MPDKKHLLINPATDEALQQWAEVIQDPKSSLMQKIAYVALDMDLLKDPEDAIASRAGEASSDQKRAEWEQRLDRYERSHFASLVKEVADLTGADPKQIADKKTRTPEQQQALLQASARRQIERLDMFYNSDYMQAMRVLEGLESPFTEPQDPDDYSLKESFLLYYFTTRPDIRPSTTGRFTKADKEALTAQYKRFEAFLIKYFGGVEKAQGAQPGEFQAALEAFIEQQTPTVIKTAKVRDVDFPVDKINKTIWHLLEEHSTGGQIGLHTEKNGSKAPVMVYYAISFDALEKQGITITKRLNAYEKRVYIAAGALHAIKGKEPFTLTELYTAMGNTGRPGSNDLEKLNAAITKMGGARIFVDNQQEIDAKYDYPLFRYDGMLLPMERVTAIVDGKVTDAAIHLFREPPLITYARQHQQLTTINIKLLQSPASKTEANIAIEDYLIERIAQARNERRKLEKKRCKTDEERQAKAEALEKAKSARILLDTLYEHAEITTKMQRQRAPEKIIRILEHYKNCSFIQDYKMDESGITLTL